MAEPQPSKLVMRVRFPSPARSGLPMLAEGARLGRSPFLWGCNPQAPPGGLRPRTPFGGLSGGLSLVSACSLGNPVLSYCSLLAVGRVGGVASADEDAGSLESRGDECGGVDVQDPAQLG